MNTQEYRCVQELKKFLHTQWEVTKIPKLFKENTPGKWDNKRFVPISGYGLNEAQRYEWHALIQSVRNSIREIRLRSRYRPPSILKQHKNAASSRIFGLFEALDSHVVAGDVQFTTDPTDWGVVRQDGGKTRNRIPCTITVSSAWNHSVGRIYDHIKSKQVTFFILHASRVGQFPDHIELHRVRIIEFGDKKTRPVITEHQEYIALGAGGVWRRGSTARIARDSVRTMLTEAVTKRLEKAAS